MRYLTSPLPVIDDQDMSGVWKSIDPKEAVLIAIACMACVVMPTARWLMPVAVQNKITRSCGESFVLVFAMDYPRHQTCGERDHSCARAASHFNASSMALL